MHLVNTDAEADGVMRLKSRQVSVHKNFGRWQEIMDYIHFGRTVKKRKEKQ